MPRRSRAECPTRRGGGLTPDVGPQCVGRPAHHEFSQGSQHRLQGSDGHPGEGRDQRSYQRAHPPHARWRSRIRAQRRPESLSKWSRQSPGTDCRGRRSGRSPRTTSTRRTSECGRRKPLGRRRPPFVLVGYSQIGDDVQVRKHCDLDPAIHPPTGGVLVVGNGLVLSEPGRGYHGRVHTPLQE